MKFKYFLRGLGVGIIFASIISITAFQSSDMNKISDKEVIERAKELGMVEKQESVQDALKHDSKQEDTQEKVTTEKATEQTTIKKEKQETYKKDNQSTEEKSESNSADKKTTEKKTTEKKTTETTKEATTQKTTTEKATTQEQKTEKRTVQITIKGGMSSYPVCQMLQDLGMIKDATEFDDYLIKNGYANRISVGTHTLTIGMSFEEIAIAISDPQS